MNPVKTTVLLRSAILLLSALLFQSVSSFATHIIGGEVTFECIDGNLDSNRYNVYLTIYRDCDNGIADFDNPAYLAIFDEAGYQQEFLLPLNRRDTLTPIIADSCLIPPNICVETTEYVLDVMLPEPTGGFYFSYMECCRNNDIVNIIEDESTGSIFLSYMSQEKFLNCDARLDFIDWPPLAICINEPIDWDHSVDPNSIRPENDLVYRLCTPLGVPREPTFRNDSTPILGNDTIPILPGLTYLDILARYDTIQYETGFNENLMLNGTPPISIDQNTGFITGIPEQLGRYVIGVCVEEYNEFGDLVSYVRRDFQYNVVECQNSDANFTVDSLYCYYEGDDLVVLPRNLTTTTDLFLWQVQGTNLTSTDENPRFILPDTGTYTITLITRPNSACADTMSLNTRAVRTGLIADFNVDIEDCSADETNVSFIDQTSFLASESIVEWEWQINGFVISTRPNFTTELAGDSSQYIVTLTVFSSDGCMDSKTDTLLIDDVDYPPLPDGDYVCEGDTVCLNPSAIQNYFYVWTNGMGDTFSFEPNPCILIQSDTCLYVEISSSSNLGCSSLDSVCLEFISEDGTPDFICTILDTINNIVQFDCVGENCDIYTVCYNDPENPTASDRASFPITYDYPDTMTAYCAVFKPDEEALKCTGIDSFKCEGPLDFEPPCCDYAFEYEVVECTDSLKIEFRVDTICSVDSVIWDIEGERYEGVVACEYFFNEDIPINGRYTIYFADSECSDVTDTFEIFVDTFYYASLDTLIKCRGDSVELNKDFLIGLEYEWSPRNAFDDPTVPNPFVCPDSDTTYCCRITDPNTGCYGIRCQTVLVIELPDVNLPGEVIYCDSSDTVCADSIAGLTYLWSCNPDHSDTLSTQACAPIDPTKEYIYLKITDENGCMEFDSVRVQDESIDVEYPEIVSLCEGDTVKIQLGDLNGNILEWIYTNPEVIVLDEGDGCIYVTSNEDVMITITVRNVHCEFVFSIVLDVFENDHFVIATANPYNVNKGTQSQLNAEAPPNSTFWWTPAETLQPNNSVSNPIAIPTETTIYTVYSEDERGCDALDTVQLAQTCICDEPYLFIPNAFSPNNDGLNDDYNLIAQPALIEDYFLAIYNRWGEEVFSTNNLANNWNGRHNGTQVNPDVYAYYLRVKCVGVEEEYTKKGNVTVLY